MPGQAMEEANKIFPKVIPAEIEAPDYLRKQLMPSMNCVAYKRSVASP